MRAFILKERGVAEITEHAPEPELKEPYGAILTPLAMAPCTSDVNTVYGTGSRKPENLILGHECVARVVEVASGVRDFRPGELVAVPAITPDWRETAIQEGNDRHAGRPFSGNALGTRCNQNFPRLRKSDHWQLCNGGYFHWDPNKNVH